MLNRLYTGAPVSSKHKLPVNQLVPLTIKHIPYLLIFYFQAFIFVNFQNRRYFEKKNISKSISKAVRCKIVKYEFNAYWIQTKSAKIMTRKQINAMFGGHLNRF